MNPSIYHLHPEKNWMNDPNGPMFLNGCFHMFYQYNPFGAEWGNMTWAHAKSPDMVHWERLPHALHPDMPYDKGGVFSGCAVVKDGIPHIIYTGVNPECQCLAIGDGEGRAFTKYEHNPIMPSRGLQGWRDPFVWRADGEYKMALGACSKEKGTWIEQYRSTDLIHWAQLENLIHSDDIPGDRMWECPNILTGPGGAMGIVLSAVPSSETRIVLGHYEGTHFTAQSVELYDIGDSYYAPNTVVHPDGRQIQFGWLREQGDIKARIASGWQGVMSLPREVWLEDGGVRQRPATEVALLFGKPLIDMDKKAIGAGECLEIGRGQAAHLDLCTNADAQFSLSFFASGSDRAVLMHVNGAANEMIFDFGAQSGGEARLLTVPFARADELRLQLFLDGTTIELFINEREAVSTRAYPAASDAEIRINAKEAMVINALRAYEMQRAL